VKLRRVCFSLLAVLFGSARLVSAGTINPGFDLLTTPSQPATIAGLGDVQEHGVPIGPGSTDTIVQRFNGLADGQSGIINAQIVALSIAGMVLDGPFAGLNFTVGLDPSNPSLGQLNVTNPPGPGGGTFTSFFDVFTDIELFNGSTLVAVVPHEDQITSVGSTPWATVPVPGYPETSQFPAGGFYITAAGIDHTGPHPHVDPASTVPEPSTMTLFGMGMAGMAVYIRRRRGPAAV
jgi:PEP-CTERM motif